MPRSAALSRRLANSAERVMSRGDRVSANSLRYIDLQSLEVGDYLLAPDTDGVELLVLGERSHLDETHHVVDAGVGQPLYVVDGRVGIAERVVDAVQQ